MNRASKWIQKQSSFSSILDNQFRFWMFLFCFEEHSFFNMTIQPNQIKENQVEKNLFWPSMKTEKKVSIQFSWIQNKKNIIRYWNFQKKTFWRKKKPIYNQPFFFDWPEIFFSFLATFQECFRLIDHFNFISKKKKKNVFVNFLGHHHHLETIRSSINNNNSLRSNAEEMWIFRVKKKCFFSQIQSCEYNNSDDDYENRIIIIIIILKWTWRYRTEKNLFYSRFISCIACATITKKMMMMMRKKTT